MLNGFREWFLEKVELVDYWGGKIKVWANPTYNELRAGFKESPEMLRGIVDKEGDFYLWDAEAMAHDDMEDKLYITSVATFYLYPDLNVVMSYQGDEIDIIDSPRFQSWLDSQMQQAA